MRKQIMALLLMAFVACSVLIGCGKDGKDSSDKKEEKPTEVVNETTPTEGVPATPTVEATPTAEATPTEAVTPTDTPTPTPTPIESKITTETKPGKVEGYSEITSLSARDINDNSMLQEYNRVLDLADYAESMKLTDVSEQDLAASLDSNSNLDDSTKSELALAVKEFEKNKVDISKAALYTNLANIKIEEGSYNTGRAVTFDPFDCVIYIDTSIVKTDEEKDAAIRLGLGYASLEVYYEDENGEKVFSSPSVYCYDASGNIVELGGFARNAVAQIIASKAEGKAAVTPDDPNFVDVMKLTIALNYINPNEPYTYEKYVSEGYEPFAESIFKFADVNDLLAAEDFCADETPIKSVETTDSDFIATFNYASKLIIPLLEYYHDQDYGNGDKNVEVYCMKNLIDTFFYKNQGYDFDGGAGYTILEDKTVVINEFTAESLKMALYTLTDQYADEIIR